MTRTAPKPLVLLACSSLKLDRPAPAMELYRGVMFQTYRANVKPAAAPNVVILSALHGFITPDTIIGPYDQRMSPERADELLATLATHYMLPAGWPASIGPVLLAGGAQYRRVMRAALRWLADCTGIEPANITETSGGIGEQRAQLGRFLRAI
ncbi:hypothetical protein R77560_04728 [Ralstonia thomasii]|uniref:DUF6884 domain-containing protein n=1 Tax=Ralstonia thomasii TaxID=3058596 RepID=A0AAD2BWJ0_9RALS|nr:DUF6884 domain-containing protein [Ralstonia sp. LMG 18095]CAJ0808490.1 hypothetical protein R77560_04728 [Ralstonia sp. LMG 18095]